MELIIRNDDMQEVEGITAQYPYVLNHVNGKNTKVPWHWHEEVEFSYVVQGSLRVTVSGRSYVFREKEGFYINSNILHTMEAEHREEEEKTVWYSYLFHPMFLGGHYKSVFETKYIAPVLKNKKYEIAAFRSENPRQKEILQLLLQAAELQGQQDCEFRIRNTFSDIWLILMRELENTEHDAMQMNPVNQERIQSMLAYIHQHYAEKITLDQVAQAALISKRECLRCFQSCIQKTPIEYLLDYRVRVAEKLLRTTSLSVTQIALQTGFSNSAYFTKMFREHSGLSPSQYRKQNDTHTGKGDC